MVIGQIKQIEEARRQRLEEQPERGPHAMVRLLARVVGIGIETADMLVNEVLSRPLRDRRAVARYAGLTGAPDETTPMKTHTPTASKASLSKRAKWDLVCMCPPIFGRCYRWRVSVMLWHSPFPASRQVAHRRIGTAR